MQIWLATTVLRAAARAPHVVGLPGECLLGVDSAIQRPLSATSRYGCLWPGAAVPSVRRKQTKENIGQIGEGLLCGASPERQPSGQNQSYQLVPHSGRDNYSAINPLAELRRRP
jgi:hypothetical protein